MSTIPFNVPFHAGGEQAYIAQAMAGATFAGNGPFTKRCQRWIEATYEVPHALLTHSCSGALELAALALECGPGDEIILPSYTFSTTASAWLRTGASVVFADVDPDTMMLDPSDVERRITPATKAICAVHYAGAAAPVDALAKLTSPAVSLVEDAAQGLHARSRDRWLGSIGRLATFSFHETKNLHCGLGGALVVNDPDLFERTEHLWERGTNRAQFARGTVDKYTWVEVGGSFYPSELQAAFLLAQLEEADRNRRERVAVWRTYRDRMTPLVGPKTFTLQRLDEGTAINGHAFYLRLASETLCDELRIALRAVGVHAHTHYVPLHTAPAGRANGGAPNTLPHTERWAGCVLRLPLHNHLTDADVEHVCTSVEEFFA